MYFNLFYEWILGKTREIPRKGILPLSANSGLNMSFYVVRNAAFEPFIPYIERALGGFGIRVSWRLSKYSDQFSDLGMSVDDKVIYFVDPAGKNWKLQQKFLNEAIISVLSISINPVTVVILGSEEEYRKPEMVLRELQARVKFLYIGGDKREVKGFTSRLSEITGLNLEPDQIIKGGLDIVFEALLKCIFEPPKILVLDLDNTLYDGVLGEQSVHSLKQNSSQANLIQSVMKFRDTNGVFTAICSRNDIADVDRLFEEREDLGFKRENFDYVLASWRPKEEMIRELINKLNIDLSSVVLIDDSVFELIHVLDGLPGVLPINADDPELALDIFEKLMSGFDWGAGASVNPKERAKDIEAAELRKSIFSSKQADDLLRSINTELHFEFNVVDSLARASELSFRTNQFNFMQSRLTEESIRALLAKSNVFVCTVSVKDDFSDSGRVCLMVTRFNTETQQLSIDEFVISCRALGRNLESEFFFGALLRLSEILKFKTCILRYRRTIKNHPCLEWCEEHLSSPVSSEIKISLDEILAFRSKVRSISESYGESK